MEPIESHTYRSRGGGGGDQDDIDNSFFSNGGSNLMNNSFAYEHIAAPVAQTLSVPDGSFVKKINISSEQSPRAEHLCEVDSGRDLYLRFALDQFASSSTTSNVFGGLNGGFNSESFVLVFNARCLAFNSISKTVTDSEHCALELFLLNANGGVVWNRSHYCNGEYSLTVPSITAGLQMGAVYNVLVRVAGPSHKIPTPKPGGFNIPNRFKNLNSVPPSSGFSDNRSYMSSTASESLATAVSQRLMVQLRVVSECRPALLHADMDTPSRGSVLEGEYAYYKVTLGPEDSNKLLRITAKAVTSSSAENSSLGADYKYESDIDLCATNRFNGLVACDLSDFGCVWKSCNSKSAELIDIHPTDKNRGSETSFLIGVYGYKAVSAFASGEPESRLNLSSYFGDENVNSGHALGRKKSISFELTVSIIDPLPIKSIPVPPIDKPSSQLVQFIPKRYSFYSINIGDIIKASRGGSVPKSSSQSARNKLDGLSHKPELPAPLPNRIVVRVSDDPAFAVHFSCNNSQPKSNHNSSPQQVYTYDRHALLEHTSTHLGLSYGKGVYCGDDFDSYSFSTAIRAQRASNMPVDSLVPVVYISTSCMYPSSSNFMWRASPQYTGSVLNLGFFLEVDELLDLSPAGSPIDTVYFSIYGHQLAKSGGGGGSGGVNDLANSSNNLRNLSFDLNASGLNESFLNTSGFMSSSSRVHKPESRAAKKLSISAWSHSINTPPKSNYASIQIQARNNLEIFYGLFAEVDGYRLSLEERQRLKLSGSNSFTYGEIEFSSFGFLLGNLGTITSDAVFCDIGCGVGKAVVAAALSDIRFVKCIGVEALPALADAAKKAADKLSQYMGSLNWSHFTLLEIRSGDAKEVVWSDADVVFFSSCCFEDDMLRTLFIGATYLKAGSKILSFKLPSYLTSNDTNDTFYNYFTENHRIPCKFSWGVATVIVLEVNPKSDL